MIRETGREFIPLNRTNALGKKKTTTKDALKKINKNLSFNTT